MNENMGNLNKRIQSAREKIDEEQKRQAQDTRSKREETLRQLDQVREEYTTAQDLVQQLGTERDECRSQGQSAESELATLNRSLEQLKSDIEGDQKHLQIIADREKSKLAPFGNNMEQVLAAIERTQWRGERPVGPLGRFVKVRDPKKWADVMRIMLGSMMSAFAITHPADRKTLESILKHHGK